MIRHEISFDFPERKKEDMDEINELLSCMELSELTLEEAKGYMCTTRSGDHKIMKRRYGLERGKFICKINTGEEKYHYQMMTEVLENEKDSQIRDYHDYWMNQHPGKIMRTMLKIQFDDAMAYLVLYHDKKGEK